MFFLTNGLCNQIKQIIDGIVSGYFSNRYDIFIAGFRRDYLDAGDLARELIHRVLNVPHLEKQVLPNLFPNVEEFRHFKIHAATNITHNGNLTSIDYIRQSMMGEETGHIDFQKADLERYRSNEWCVPSGKEMIRMLSNDYNQNITNIDIYIPFFYDESILFMSDKTNVHNWDPTYYVDYFFQHLQFHDNYYHVANRIMKEKILFGNKRKSFKAIHLRLEDDMIEWCYYRAKQFKPLLNLTKENINDLLVVGYHTVIKMYFHSEDTIFLSTSLGKYPNRNNGTLNTLIQFYKHVIVLKNEDIYENNQVELPKGREIAGIVESLICEKAELFLGFQHSTYSRMVGLRAKKNGARVLGIDFDNMLQYYPFGSPVNESAVGTFPISWLSHSVEYHHHHHHLHHHKKTLRKRSPSLFNVGMK